MESSRTPQKAPTISSAAITVLWKRLRCRALEIVAQEIYSSLVVLCHFFCDASDYLAGWRKQGSKVLPCTSWHHHWQTNCEAAFEASRESTVRLQSSAIFVWERPKPTLHVRFSISVVHQNLQRHRQSSRTEFSSLRKQICPLIKPSVASQYFHWAMCLVRDSVHETTDVRYEYLIFRQYFDVVNEVTTTFLLYLTISRSIEKLCPFAFMRLFVVNTRFRVSSACLMMFVNLVKWMLRRHATFSGNLKIIYIYCSCWLHCWTTSA